MANIIDRITLGEKELLIVDANPAASLGTASAIGSSAFWDDGAVGRAYLKVGAADTAWDQYSTGIVNGTVNYGTQNRLAAYPNSGSSNVVDDQLTFGSFQLDILVGAHTLIANRTYTVPDVGTNAEFIMTEGAQVKNGDLTLNDDLVVQGDMTVNGTLTYVNTVNLNVTDKLITVNKGGAADSGNGAGIEIEENAVITAYFKTESATPTTQSWLLKAPDSEELTMNLATLTAPRTVQFQDRSGYAALQSPAALSQGSVPFVDAGGLLAQNNARLYWDNTSFRLGINTNAPGDSMHVVGNLRVSGSGSIMRLLADSDFRVAQATVNTTDASTSTAMTVAIPTDTCVMLTAHVVARRTGGSSGNPQDSAVYVRTARLKNVAGTVTLATLQSDYTSEDQMGWNATVDVNGTNARVRVTGANNNNVQWEVTAFQIVND